jgi:predicted RNA-binding protein associated with RNAse of E/G family
MAERRWCPGELVVLRYLTMHESLPGMSWPCRVVEDRNDLVALYVPAGTVFKAWGTLAGTRRLVDTRWRRDMLRLMFPGRGYSIWLTWEPGAGRRFSGYYVNMEEPFRRTSIGFDTNDHMLDVVVTPDLTWAWKDEEVMADRVRRGVYSPAFAAAVRAEAEQVIAVIEANGPPFCDGWDRWTPDPRWAIPELPANWDTAPVVPWERSAWAYGAGR